MVHAFAWVVALLMLSAQTAPADQTRTRHSHRHRSLTRSVSMPFTCYWRRPTRTVVVRRVYTPARASDQTM